MLLTKSPRSLRNTAASATERQDARLGRAAALFFRERRPGPGLWGHADLWLAFQWAGQRLRSGGDVGRATVLAQGMRMAFEFSSSTLRSFPRRGTGPRGSMKTGGTVVTKSRKPLARCPFQKHPGIPEPGPGPPPPTPRTSRPAHRKLRPEPSKPRCPGRGGCEAPWASSSRPRPSWSLDPVLTF